MSLLDTAGVVLIPSAYKASKLYSIIPSNGDGDLTFTRASSGSRVNESGFVREVANNIPRLDYSDDINIPSILFEPVRKNLLKNSKFQNMTSWNTWFLSVGTNTGPSPTGEQNALRTTVTVPADNVAFIDPILEQTILKAEFTTATTFTLSIYAKGVGNTIGRLCTFFLVRDTYTEAQTSNFTLTSEWKRFTATFTLSAQATTSVNYRIDLPNWEPVDGDQVLIWGPQLEAASFPTTYKETTLSATVTREQESLENTGSIANVLNAAEGCFYLEAATLAGDTTVRKITLSDKTANNYMMFEFPATIGIVTFDIFGQNPANTIINYEVSTTVDTTQFHKYLIKWGTEGIFAYIDGAKFPFYQVTAGVGTGIPKTLSSLRFRTPTGATLSSFLGKCRGLQVYKTALSHNECVDLTIKKYFNYFDMATNLKYTTI
jgi:hypothetical protein